MGSIISVVGPYHRSITIGLSTALVGGAHFLTSAKNTSSALVDLGHLGSFAVWFGSQFWVTFVAGLTMVTILPRNWFAKVQRVLFDHYFLGGVLMNSAMLSTFMIKHPFSTWHGQTSVMGNGLIASLACVGLNCFLVKPWVTNTSKIMQDFEGDRGLGNEPGSIKDKNILTDPKYVVIKKEFVKAHSLSAILNLFNMCFSTYHLWYLGSHISF